MNIQDILNQLDIDMADSEAVRGVIEAIDAIKTSRRPAPQAVGGVSGGQQDIEVDPDLLQPSEKQSSAAASINAEVEDEEHLLDQIKHKDGNVTASSSTSDSNNGSGTSSESETGGSGDSNSTSMSSANNDSNTNNDNSDNQNSDDAESAGNNGDSFDFDDTEEEKSEENTKEAEDNLKDLVDPDYLDSLTSEEEQKKNERKIIHGERAISAGEKALELGKQKNKSKSVLNELQEAIDELEKVIQDKSLAKLDDNTFAEKINRIYSAIELIDTDDITIKSADEVKAQIDKIQQDINSVGTRNSINQEDKAIKKLDDLAVKAREAETDRYRDCHKDPGSFASINVFLDDVLNAMTSQVGQDEDFEDTWSALNRRYDGTGVIRQGIQKIENDSKDIPVIDFYFDRSGSWTGDRVASDTGKIAVAQLADLESSGDIKVNLFYFGNFVSTNESDHGGGTGAWEDILKNIESTEATNVVIMTDSDMQYDADRCAKKVSVPGYVWYIWRHGSNSQFLPEKLNGQMGTYQYKL